MSFYSALSISLYSLRGGGIKSLEKYKVRKLMKMLNGKHFLAIWKCWMHMESQTPTLTYFLIQEAACLVFI